MTFNWPQFLDAYAVHYVTSGPNTGRGQVSVRCPLCGDADPSEHLVINLKGSKWWCGRNRSHNGSSRARLIMLLLHCSLERAKEASGENEQAVPSDEDFATKIASALGLTPDRPVAPRSLDLPADFRPLDPTVFRPSAIPYLGYLMGRGYTDDEINWLIEAYGLHYATSGQYRNRIIIPIYDAWRQLLTWTGRSILSNATLRYKTLPTKDTEWSEEGDPPALAPPGSTLLGMPLIRSVDRGRTLVITEGPFDAMTVSALGHGRGVYGTCLFGLRVSPEQVNDLITVAPRFDRICIGLDEDASLLAMKMLGQFPLPIDLIRLPGGIKDPGDLARSEAGPTFVNALAA